MKQRNVQISSIIEKLIILLRNNDAEDWAIVFEKLLRDYTSSDAKREAARNIIHIFQGGMGSFNDFVLQKNMEMLIEENNELDKLKRDLFNSCLDLI